MADVEWKCCGCGAVSGADRVRSCDCATNVLYRKVGDHLVHEIKQMSERDLISERGRALILAAAVLDRPSADPDDDLAILARQLTRAQEEIDKLNSQHDRTMTAPSVPANANLS